MSQVTTYYLEMKSPSLFKEGKNPKCLEVAEVGIRQFQLNKFLYQYVGEPWEWTDKLSWSDSQWQQYIERENLKTWLAYIEGSPAGYYELEQLEGGNTEIAYFGLTPVFIGKGIGGYFLSEAIKSAWDWAGTKRVWAHTCTLDHPGALKNYLSRGMEIYHKETDNK
jgi:GNAT superfamily N-acetyltransferase